MVPVKLLTLVLMGAGGTPQTFTLTFTDISDSGASPSASFIVKRDGDLTFGPGNSVTGDDAAEWVEPRSSTVGDDFELRVTVNSGSPPTFGTTASWIAMTTDLTYSLLRLITPGTNTGNWTLEIRRASDSVVVADTTFDISATLP